MAFLTLPPGDLHPNPWNSNRLTPEAETKLRESIQRFGIFKPIVAREIVDGGETRYEILGGQHRWEIAAELGVVEVPVFSVGRIPDDKAKEIGLVDNARYGHDDADLLANLIAELDPQALIHFMPISEAEIETMSRLTTVDYDNLALEEEDAPAVALPAPKTIKTHAIMRFKVPIADQPTVEAHISAIIADQGLEDSDSLVNAGDALMHLIRERAS